MWRQFPTEIESDLSAHHGRRISEWHRGTMSSRELLVYARHFKETGAYKTALRDGGWPEFMQVISDLHKEVALLRAMHYVGGENQYTPKVFLDPRDRERVQAEQADAERAIEEAQEGMASDLGWT